ncbi:MAG: AMP-binding protein [Thermoanaerobaculia bacterium]
MNWLARQARANPHAPAVRAGERVLTYAGLAGAAARAAEVFREAGVGPGERVAVRLGNRLEHVVAIHGAAWAGAVLVEIHPKLAPAEVPDLLKAAKARLLVTEAEDPVASPVVRPSLPCPVLAASAVAEEAPGGGFDPPPAPRRADAVSSVLFTSGTTGRPRPVPLTCGNHLASAAASAWNLGIRPDDDWLCCLPLAHVGGLAILVRSVLQGTCVTLLDGFDPAAVGERLSSGRVSLASLVPTMLRRFLEVAPDARGDDPGGSATGEPGNREPLASPRLRAVLLGGGPADPELVAAARDRGLPVLTTYGMTETASQVATLPPGAPRPRWASAGLPLPGAEVAIRRKDGSGAKPGEPGEIAVRGPMVCQEAAGPGGWLATGDLGRLDGDGFLWVEGRLDELVVTGGENVSPREVERVLREHPAVAEVAVAGVPDPEWGHLLAAALVPRNAADPPSPGALASWCRERLAPFKVPKRWRIVEELPRTGSGKVAREQVQQLLV